MAHTAHGHHVGYSLKKVRNEPTYTVFFRAPGGARHKRDTNQTGLERAKRAAEAIIDEEYAPAKHAAEVVTWDEAARRIRERAAADGLRGPSIDYYCKLVRRIHRFYSATAGPADISAGMADTWKKTFAATPSRRKKLPSQHTVFSLVRGFSALWQSWFMDRLGICPGNPWQDVEPPKTDKVEVKVIDDDTLTHFLGWLDERFHGWELPRLFLETKAVTGCRLMDLCGIESGQLRDGRLHFRAEQTKGRKARSVRLPAGLFAPLDAIKGETYLWESQPQGLKEAVRKMGRPAHRIKPDFVPSRFYYWATTLFLDYRAANPDRPAIHSHQLRKRAFTAAWKNNIDPRKAAIAYGCNVDTVMRHYVQLDEQAVTDEVTDQLAGVLVPKAAKG
jgi:integrase